MKIRTSYIDRIFIFIILLLLLACAQKVVITGGEKDADPPSLIRSNPDTFSTHFNSNRITLEFDEFVQLNNIRKNLLVTPVFKNDVSVLASGKKVTIKNIDDSLIDNATYVIEFNEGIKDITENNPAKGFRYVFSTGDYVDSLGIAGQIKNAFTLEPVKDIFVFLYTEDYDSIPYKEVPRYMGRSNKNGVFTIRNMKEGKYKAFVCSDENGNYLFDGPSEKIDFSDDLIEVKADSIPRFFALLFSEDHEKQYLKSYGSGNEWSFYLVYNKPVDSLSLFAEGVNEAVYKYNREYNETRDSVVFWAPDSSMKPESLDFFVQVDTFASDTMSIKLKNDPSARELKIKHNLLTGKILNLGKDFIFTSNLPLISLDSSKIRVYRDSIEIEYLIELNKAGKELVIKAKWKEDKSYRVVMDSAAFSNINGRSIDSSYFTFNTRKANFYGSLEIDLDVKATSGMLFIMNEQNKVIEKVYLESENKYVIPFLNPGTYKLKYIIDENENRKWDSGNYLEGRHAEKVHIYQGIITIRSNWDQVIEWKFN